MSTRAPRPAGPGEDAGRAAPAAAARGGWSASTHRALWIVALALLLLGVWRLHHRPGPDLVPVPDDPRLEVRLDLNRASAAELEALPGVGPALAARIAEHRARNGPFRRVEELAVVPGVGEQKMRALESWVTVGP